MSAFLRRRGGWTASAAAAAVLCGGVVLYERGRPGYDALRLFCDGFFVAGTLLAGVGALLWIARSGGFSALGYAQYLIRRKWFSSDRKFQERLTYLEYARLYGEKRDRRPRCAVVTGAACVAVSLALLFFQR